MRLQLTVARVFAGVLAGLVMASPNAHARGPGEIATRVDRYEDGWIKVTKGGLRGSAKATKQTTVSAQYNIDVLSGATPVLVTDVVSTATSFVETRHDAAFDAKHELSTTASVNATGRVSTESDFRSFGLSLGGQVELMKRHATAAITFSAGSHRAWRKGDTSNAADSATFGLAVSWAHLLNADTELTVLAETRYASCAAHLGCDANPYRYVPTFTAAHGWVAVTERHPDKRGRGAVGLRLRRYLGGGFGLHVGARGYRDSWQMTGYTLDSTVAHDSFGGRLVLRANARWSQQSAASFYRSRYVTTSDSTAAWRTADREVTGLQALYLGASGAWTVGKVGPFGAVAISARLRRMDFTYPDYSPMPKRDAWLVGGGVDAAF